MHPGGLARSCQKQNNAPTPRDNFFFSKMQHSPHVPGGFPGVSPGSTPGKANDKCIKRVKKRDLVGSDIIFGWERSNWERSDNGAK